MIRAGNRLAVSPDALRKVCHGTRAAAEAAVSKRKKSLAEVHNDLLAHTLLGLFLTTGGRPVRDPFNSIDLFSLEMGLAILIDKVMDRSKEARLVVLAKDCLTQLQHWLDHLQALAATLSVEQPELAAQIYAVTQPDLARPIPLFFLLKDDLSGIERIGRKTYEDMLRPYWTLPANFQRSSLSTWLKQDGCSGELVDMQLGHASAGNTPHGLASPVGPIEARELLQPRLDRYLADIGWQSLPGLRMPRFHRLEKIQKLAKKLTTDAAMGPGARADARAYRWAEDAIFVTALVKERFPTAFDDENPIGDPARFPREIGDDDVRTLIDAIFDPSDGSEGRALVRLQMLRRFLARLRRAGIKVVLPGRMATINPEASPFSSETFVQAKRAEVLRSRLVAYFAEQGKAGTTPSRERRVAEIMVAAPLFSALTWKRSLEALPNALRCGTNFWQNKISVDLRIFERNTADLEEEQNDEENEVDTHKVVRRWYPDSMSASLILGYRQANVPDEQRINSAKLFGEMKSLLAALEVPMPRVHARTKPRTADVVLLLAQLLESARAYWRLRLPGLWRGYAEGDVLCASLPLHSLVRLTSGKALDPTRIRQRSPRAKADTQFRDPGLNFAPDSLSPVSGQNFWKKLDKMLSPNKKAVGKRARGWKRARLAVQIRRIAREHEGMIPPVALAIAAWGINLCVNGTRFEANLAISTVIKYIREVGRPLIDLASDTDFLNLSSIGFTAIYSDVVAGKNRDMRGFTAGRLEEFHCYLVARHGVADADWDEIYPEDAQSRHVDAGLVTEAEYLHAFDLLKSDPHTDERARNAATVFLLLAYRFGLRRGEICRLLRRDVQIFGTLVALIVNNTIYGETKTNNGIRQIPLIEAITDAEREALDQWLLGIDTYAAGVHLTALFGDRNDLKTCIDLTRLAARVTEALQATTGDPAIRLHYLRHGFANRLYLCGASDSTEIRQMLSRLSPDLSPEQIRKRLTERNERSRRLIYAMSLALGHGGPSPLLESYVHLADICLAAMIRTQDSQDFGDHALSYCLQVTGGSLRVSRHRLQQSEEKPADASVFERLIVQIANRQSWQNLSEMLATTGRVAKMEAPELLIDRTIFGPADLDRLLLIQRHRTDDEGLAEAFHLDDKTLGQIKTLAVDVERRSGFTVFGVASVDDPHWGLPRHARDPIGNLSGTRRAHRFLRAESTIASLLQHHDELPTFTELWTDAHHANSGPLLFANYQDALRFVGLSECIGLDRKSFDLHRPSDLESPDADSSKFAWRSLPEKKRLALRADKVPAQRWARIAVTLGETSSPIAYQSSLNRILFGLSIWCRIDFNRSVPAPKPSD